MSVVELEVETRKIVKDPRISLTMVGRLVVASERGQLAIIKKCKYPSKFVPGYHEMARKLPAATSVTLVPLPLVRASYLDLKHIKLSA